MASPDDDFYDVWLINELRTRQRRSGWAPLMTAAADRLEQLTKENQR